MTKHLPALGLVLALAACRQPAPEQAPLAEEDCPAPPASAPASSPALSSLDVVAARYAQVGVLGATQEITVNPDGRYRWELHGCTGETAIDGAASLSGDLLSLRPAPGTDLAELGPGLLVLRRLGARRVLLREEEVEAFALRPSARLGLVELRPGEDALGVGMELAEREPEENPQPPVWEAGVPLPNRLHVSIERPGPAAGRYLNLQIEARPYRVVITGCESNLLNGPCFATVDIWLGVREWVELNRLWWSMSYPLSCPQAVPTGTPRQLRMDWREGGISDSYSPELTTEDLASSCIPHKRLASWIIERFDAGSK
jgi:hypothetical protein